MAKDLIGDVTEVSVRANFFQVFEILCEVMVMKSIYFWLLYSIHFYL